MPIKMEAIDSLKGSISQLDFDTSDSCIFFNLAWAGYDKLSDMSVSAQTRNVWWSANAFIVADSLSCAKFIHAGSMEELFATRYLELDHKREDKFNRHVIYGMCKDISKRYLRTIHARSGMDLIFTRNSHVMGPNDPKDSFLQVTLDKLINGGPLVFSTGEQMFDVISTYDCAKAYKLLGIYGCKDKDYWIGSGSPRSLRDYVEEMGSLYKSEEPMQFGALTYNDVSLDYEDFDISNLQTDTGFTVDKSFKEIVHSVAMGLM